MKMDAQMIRNLVSLGYVARESGLEVEEIVDMIEKGFVAIHPERQTVLFSPS